jgi:hypothetical protein
VFSFHYNTNLPIPFFQVMQALKIRHGENVHKFILISFLILLQGCVGVSLLLKHKGIHLDSPNNVYEPKPEFESLAYGYSSSSVKDPGNPVQYNDGENDIHIEANCHNERAVSFSPSVIFPFPPIIPLFGNGEGIADQELVLHQPGCAEDLLFVKEIFLGEKKLEPYKIRECKSHFALMCSEVGTNGKVILEGQGKTISIDIEYKKTFNILWGWWSA